MNVVQVVKKFGLCGGMEEYAYRLANELCILGVEIKVVCEEKLNNPKDSKIEIFELGKTLKKPRWLSHLLFAKKVKHWVSENTDGHTIVHSHERIDCHQITTIHSTLYNFPPKRKFPSLRNYCNEYIERRELNCASVQKIVPVSGLIINQISEKYTNTRHKLASPIPPGVSHLNAVKKEFDPEVPVIGFMGKEWKRKGLPKVIEIWRELRKKIPLVRLCLAGFPIDEPIGIRKDELKFVDLLGYVKRKEDFFEKIDILLHPAKREAYGMVIAEAANLKIPVLCSDLCGAAFHNLGSVQSINLKRPNNHWALKALEMINESSIKNSSSKSYSWRENAQNYLDLYNS
jgi:UDP-glucose:(heptosyl)LPS alpha-1,3-glucosyltransferase